MRTIKIWRNSRNVEDEECDPQEAECETREIDDSDGDDPVDVAVDVIRGAGCILPSASFFHAGVWYSNEQSMDMRGNVEEVSCHLKGFSKGEEEAIWRRMQ